MKFCQRILIMILFGFLLLPLTTSAQVVISEIMYDLEGSDTKKEWVEICNTDNDDINISGWWFNDGSNHGLNEPPENGGQGSLTISSQECAILTGNAETFLNLHTGYSGTVIDTVMSLNNTADNLLILDANKLEIDSVTYNSEWGANGDGNSLQKVGNEWVANTPTPGDFSNSGQEQNNNEGFDGEEDNVSSSSDSSLDITYTAPIKTITVNAGDNKTVTVGADTFFEGKAYGTEGEPLVNAEYVWNFGNGSRKVGQKVLHSYNYPGDYIVFLDVKLGKYSSCDRIDVKALPANLNISNIKYGVDGFVELENKESRELELSWWRISHENFFYTIPKNTFILPNSKIIFPTRNTGLILKNNLVKLHYPNGTVADDFKAELFPPHSSQNVAPPRLPTPARSPSLRSGVSGREAVGTGGQESSAFINTGKTDDHTEIVDKLNHESVDQGNHEIATTNTASVVNSISGGTGDNGSTYKWLLGISIIILIAISSIILRKPKPKLAQTEQEITKISNEIEIK